MHLRHQAPTEGGKGRGTKVRDLTKKAVLLSGPPGIGKTSSALILARYKRLCVQSRMTHMVCFTVVIW